jgi:peptidoglycan/LPS O-acetylase OafA/YrhL
LSWASGLFFDRWLLLRTYINHPFQHNGALGVLLAAASNVTLMGQDWVMFLRHDYGHPLQLTGNFWNDPSPLWRFLLIPQSWSIGVELTFYACAPYLNRLRSRWLVCIAVVALAARLIGYGCLGLAHDPWSYRFFPFEIALFVFGMLGYRLYALTEPRHPTRRWRCDSNLSYLAGAAVLLLVLYLDSGVEHRLSLVVGPELAVLVKYPFLIIGIPVLFFATGKNKIDRLIGELSYPIYLVHYLILVLVANILSYLGIGKGLGVIGAIGSIIVAALFYRFFIARLDSKRHLLTVKAPDSGDTAAQERNVAAG